MRPIADDQPTCDNGNVPDLLHEFWRSEFEGEFGLVSQIGDDFRAKMSSDLNFVFEVLAASWSEAMRLYEERAYNEYGKSYDQFPDTVYTDEDFEAQQAYLVVRGNVR